MMNALLWAFVLLVLYVQSYNGILGVEARYPGMYHRSSTIVGELLINALLIGALYLGGFAHE